MTSLPLILTIAMLEWLLCGYIYYACIWIETQQDAPSKEDTPDKMPPLMDGVVDWGDVSKIKTK